MIVLLSGKAQSGKDTVGAILVQHRGFHRYAFADRVRELGIELLGLPAELLSPNPPPDLKSKCRPDLIRLGNGMRAICEAAWVNAVAAKIKRDGHDRAAITDWRFPNEGAELAARFPGRRVLRWRIEAGAAARSARMGAAGWASYLAGPAADVSECALDAALFDRYVENNGTIADLEAEVLRSVRDVPRCRTCRTPLELANFTAGRDVYLCGVCAEGAR